MCRNFVGFSLNSHLVSFDVRLISDSFDFRQIRVGLFIGCVLDFRDVA